jgi:hypothetical protein
MTTLMKYAVAAALTGAMALAAASPSEARSGRNATAAIGFGAGALVGAAAANSYYNGYYNGQPGYYSAGYGYEADDAYEPAPVYVGRAPGYYGRGYRSNLHGCLSSPASPRFNESC